MADTAETVTLNNAGCDDLAVNEPPPADEGAEYENEYEEADAEPEEPPEPECDRLATIAKIRLYQNSSLGKKYLKHLNFKRLEDKGNAELLDLLVECKFTLSVRNADKWMASLINKGVILAEVLLCSQTPLKVAGLAEIWNKSASIQELVEEISLEYSRVTYMKPEYRLGIAVAGLIAELHSANTIREAQQRQKMAETLAKQASAAKDL